MTTPTGPGSADPGPPDQGLPHHEPTGHKPPGHGPTGQGQPQPGDDPEERDPGLARERTSLSWARTAISFAALGGVVLRANVITGLVILAVAPFVWELGRVTRGKDTGTGLPAVGATRLFIIALSIVAVSLLCLVVAIFGRAVPGALR
jgi:uncharacterized membrane protein YidH (DUF202 family)